MSKQKKKTPSDNELIELFWNKNEDAIRLTDDKYGAYLLTISYNILGNKLDAEECQNDTYLDTWNAIPPTRPNFFQLFLTKIARRISIDRYREKNRQKRIPSEMTSTFEEYADILTDDMTVEDQYDAKAIAEIIGNFLRTQEKNDQILFIYRYYFGDSAASLSEQFAISKRTVYSRLESMRSELKSLLIKEGFAV